MNNAVLYEVNDGVALVTLNRPRVLNAMDYDLLHGSLEILEAAASDVQVKAVVITGAGRGFCSGADISGENTTLRLPPGTSLEKIQRSLQNVMRISQLLYEMPKPTLAAVNGPAVGGGFSLACAADLRYASESAYFYTAYAARGLPGDFGGSWMLPRLVGLGRAKEMYLLPEKVSADEALRIGLVQKVFADDELLPAALAAAKRMAEIPAITTAAIKQNFYEAEWVGYREAIQREGERHIRAKLTEEVREFDKDYAARFRK